MCMCMYLTILLSLLLQMAKSRKSVCNSLMAAAGYVLGFVLHFNAKGLWMGSLTGSVLQVIILTVVTVLTDWQKEVGFYFFNSVTVLTSPLLIIARVICFFAFLLVLSPFCCLCLMNPMDNN